MPLTALRRLSVYTAFLFICSIGLVACGGSDSPEPPPAASSSAGGGASSSSDEPSSSSSSSSSSVSSSEDSSASSSSDASSSSSEPAPDLTPEAFSFDAKTNVERGATITSNTVTIQGIDAETVISIVGGHYAVNGGDFTSGSANVEKGDEVMVRVAASADFAVESSATLTVGGVDGTFTVTTVEKDTMPDELDFTPKQDMQPGEEATSNAVTINGINAPAVVEVSGGSYSVNEGEFTAEAGEVTEGDTLSLKGVSPEEASATQEVTVTVGGVAGVWALTTREDIEPPEAAFVFPTPMTATEGDTVIVRGTASDESTVTGVTLQVTNDSGITDLNLESENDFATWQKQVTLVEGENTITLSAEDEAGNVLTDGDSVTVVRQNLELAFPDEELPIDDPKKLVYDEKRERVLFANLADTLIYAVDISTGKRSAFFTAEMAPELGDYDYASGLELVPGSEKVLLLMDDVSNEGPGVLRIDLETKEYEVVLTRDSQPDDQPNFTGPSSLRLDPDNSDRAIMLDSSVDAVISLNLTTGVRTLISNNDAQFSGPLMRAPNDLLIDADSNRALVADNRGGHESLYWVDLETGDRTLLLTEGEPDGTPEFHMASMTTDDISERVYGTESHSWALWSVDTKTGEYKVISDESTPNSYNPVVRLSGVSLSSDGEYLIGVDQDLGPAVYVIDLKTGERLYISKNSGPDNFSR